jgi:hypothetical protein
MGFFAQPLSPVLNAPVPKTDAELLATTNLNYVAIAWSDVESPRVILSYDTVRF